MKFNKRQFIIAITILITLFAGTLLYISLPYIKNWCSQYSYKLERLGDASSPEKAIIYFRKAEFISPNESLYLKIGELYDEAGKVDLATRYFDKIKSENAVLGLAKHHLMTGHTDKAAALLKNVAPSDDQVYLNTLILALESPQKALETIPETKDDRLTELRDYLTPLVKNTNIKYTDTAIALYLYKNNYDSLAINKLEKYQEDSYKDAHILLGDIYTSQTLYKKAATAFENSIAVDPYDINVLTRLISVYEKLGDKIKLAESKEKLKNLTISIQN